MPSKRNIYTHSIDLKTLNIKNRPRSEFAKCIEQIEYRGYEVETLSDGRKIVIAKPGGKQSYGSIKREDFFVFIFNPSDLMLWQITHKQIYEDLVKKSEINQAQTLEILKALEKVYNGAEPDEILSDSNLENPIGENPEALIKAYKWIWGQEDVNYPDGKGRAMSWEGLDKQGDKWVKTGIGIKDLLEKLQKNNQ